MKALELTMHPKNADGDYVETVEGRRYTHAFEVADVYAMDKRLTDAELAAEYHSACVEHAWVDRGLAIGASTTQDAIDSYSTTQILHRFATLPHYDEAPSPTTTTGPQQ